MAAMYQILVVVILLIALSPAQSSWLARVAEHFRARPTGPLVPCDNNNVKFYIDNVQYVGPITGFVDKLMASPKKPGTFLSVDVKGTCGPFVRPTTSVLLRANHSDILVFSSIFIRHEFAFVDVALQTRSPVQNIIDLGMNVGLSVMYWSEHYPHAKVIGVEPQLENFALAGLNLAHRRHVFTERAAVTHQLSWGSLKSFYPGDWGWGTQAAAKEKLTGVDAFQTITIPYLLEKYGWEKVDLLKIDIEGGELSLCRDILNGAKWIRVVRCCTFEYHDRFFWKMNGTIERTCEAAMQHAGLLHHEYTEIDHLHMYCRS